MSKIHAMVDDFNMNRFNVPRIVLKTLCERTGGLKFTHFNAQSLFPKFDEFIDTFASIAVDIIGVSETWLKPSVADNIIKLPKFSLFRNDRETRGGGVALYVRDSLKATFVASSVPNDVIEYLFIEVTNGVSKILIGCVYRPPNTTSIKNSSLEAFLESNICKYSDVVICGDFDANLLLNCTEANDLYDFIRIFDLSTANKTFPTHFTSSSSTLLDLFLISNVSNLICYDQISFPAFSKHDLIFLSYDWQYDVEPVEAVFQYPDFYSVDCQSLFDDASDFNWNSVLQFSTVDEQIDAFTDAVNQLFKKHVPLKTHKNISANRPWFNNNIRLLIRQRDEAFRRWKHYRLDEFYSEFKKLRNKVVSTIRSAKQKFYASKLDVKLPTKKLWSNLRNIGIGKTKSSCPIDIDLDELNKFFTSSVRDLDDNLNQIDDIIDSSCSLTNLVPFSFSDFTEVDVGLAIFSIKSNAVGVDNIHPNFIKTLLPVVLPTITSIFNNILNQNCFPSLWKTAKIIPIPKKTYPGPSDYRPIAILPFLSKVFEKLLHNQISPYLENNNLLSAFQSGFRKNRSCTTALLKVSDDIRMGFDNDEITILTLLDFSKAFDSVNHPDLLRKLKNNFHFDSSALCLMASYLSRRQQFVSNGIDMSSVLANNTGVPQGSILGPLLFSMFINDLSSKIKYCHFHKYADDVQIYISCNVLSTSCAIKLMNNDLNSIYSWASGNHLLLNASKSQTIIFSRKDFDQSMLDSICINGSTLSFSESVRNLGLIFDSKLSWKSHIDSLVGKIYGTLRKLSVTSQYTPEKTRLSLVKSLILPLFMFGCEIFRKADSTSLRKLEIAFNSCIRYIYNLRRGDHVSKYRKSVLMCSLQSFFEYRSVLLLSNIMLSGQPSYLLEKVNFGTSDRSRSICAIRTYYKISSSQFFPATISCWNNLPLHIRRHFGDKDFKSILTEYYSNIK